MARKVVERLDLGSHPLLGAASRRPGLLARLRSILPSRAAPAAAADPLDPVAASVLAGLEVAPVRNSHLVRVSWVSPDPALAANVANGVADAYIQLTMQSQFSTSDQASEFLVDQIAKLKEEIATHEGRLQDYGEAKRIVSVDDASNITLQALRDIGERRTEAQNALAAAEAAWGAVRDASPEALPEVLHSTLIQQLRREYAGSRPSTARRRACSRTTGRGCSTLDSKLEQATRAALARDSTDRDQVRAAAARRLRTRAGRGARTSTGSSQSSKPRRSD